MLTERRVDPEILDSLPEDDPAALANRRDLRRINFLMGNHRWFARTLPSILRPDDRIIELGAGAGDLGLHLRRKKVIPAGGLTGLDRCSRPKSWPEEWGWIQEDLVECATLKDYSVIMANLLHHQFSDHALRQLGRCIEHAPRAIVCVEPARRRIHQVQLKFLAAFGLHQVSRHDGHVSIAAGFRKRELPILLGLTNDEWRIQIFTTFLGAYRMVATRRTIPGRRSAP